LQKLIHGHAGQRRLGGNNFVQVVDIRLVMLVMVNLHGLRVDVRFQRVVRVRQLGQSERRIGRRNRRRGGAHRRQFQQRSSSQHGLPL